VHEEMDADLLSLLIQSDLNNLVLDLNLPRQSVELLASGPQEKHLHKTAVIALIYHNRKTKLTKHFLSDGDLFATPMSRDLVLLWAWASKSTSGGGLAPYLEFDNFSKIGCFLSFEWEKKFHHFWLSSGKTFGKIHD